MRLTCVEEEETQKLEQNIREPLIHEVRVFREPVYYNTCTERGGLELQK